jgi:hypothetical protein
MIHPVGGTGDIVVVAQELLCWLPIALAWGLPVTAVFVQARLHLLFAHLMENTVVWGTLQEWSALMQWPIDWETCMVLGSGKSDFLSVVLPKLSMHVGLLLYSMDMVFTGHHLQLVCGLYSSWSRKWWLKHDLRLVVVAHTDFGGITKAIHLIAYHGMASSCFAPQGALAQTLVHIINPVSQVRAQAIKPPKPVELPLLRMPIVCGDLLRGEGLFDISCPKLNITCCSVFKPSDWVRWRLTPKEFLRVFDIPSFLIPQLLED